MIPWLIGAAACVAAYVIGRARPWKRVRDWAAWQTHLMNFGPGWRGKAKVLLCLALNLDLLVAAYWRRWKRRNDPPAKPVEVHLNPEWRERVDRARAERAKQAQATTEEATDEA